MKRTKNIQNPQMLKRGALTLLFTALLLALLIVVNLAVNALPSGATKFDTSTVGFYEISTETKDILSSVNVPVTLYLIAGRGQEDITVLELLRRYEDLSENLQVVTVDPATNPGFTAKYTEEELPQNSVIAVSARRHYVVNYSSIYQVSYENITEEEYYNYLYYGVQPSGTPYFYGETVLTTAVDYVAAEAIPTVYLLSSHNEETLSDTIKANFSTNNILLQELNLLSAGSVPSDCSAVFIHNPKTDLSAYEADILKQYMEEGGDLILVTDFRYCTETAMPNLLSLCTRMGMALEEGLVVETNASHYNSHPGILLPIVGSGGPVDSLTNKTMPTMLPNAHGIRLTGEGKAAAAALLKTSSDAFVKKNITENSSYEKEEGDVDGTFSVAAYSSLGDSQMVWYATPYVLNDSMDYYVNGGNSLLFMASVNWMCDKTVAVSVAAKTMQVQALVIPAAAGAFWSLTLTFLLPACILGGGVFVWLRRRRK